MLSEWQITFTTCLPYRRNPGVMFHFAHSCIGVTVQSSLRNPNFELEEFQTTTAGFYNLDSILPLMLVLTLRNDWFILFGSLGLILVKDCASCLKKTQLVVVKTLCASQVKAMYS